MSFIERPLQRVTEVLAFFIERRSEEKVAESYLRDLGLTWNYLQGKDVLDIGAGQAKFAKAAKRRGTNVVSLDIEPGGWGGDGKMPSGIPYIIADFMEGTSLPAQSFDLIVEHGSILCVSREQLKSVLNEAKRLLRPGGEFRFTNPLSPGLTPFDLTEDNKRKFENFISNRLPREETSAFEKIIARLIRQKEQEWGFTENMSEEEKIQFIRGKALRLLQETNPFIKMVGTESDWGIRAFFIMRNSK